MLQREIAPPADAGRRCKRGVIEDEPGTDDAMRGDVHGGDDRSWLGQ